MFSGSLLQKADVDDAAAAANGHAKNGDGADHREEEEEDKTKTFEEYLAEKANAANALPSLKKDVRKPNEGADDSQWKNAVKFVKGEEEEEVFFQPKVIFDYLQILSTITHH
jgi:plasminogen activator inhibitor 1 RNA-binding protein